MAAVNMGPKLKERPIKRLQRFAQYIYRYRDVYILAIPTILFYFIFSYIPMYGITIAFKEFNYAKGILGSPWVGFHNFELMFNNPYFFKVLMNTLLISFGRIIIEFPAPILIAVLLNEFGRRKLKRFFQTVYTFPNFISWVVVSGMVLYFFSSNGFLNEVSVLLGFEKTSVLTNPTGFLVVLFGSSIWKSAGWASIIYLAAITAINTELYEAAKVDGAGKFRQFRSVTWPGILPTVTVMLILSIGNVMNAGFEQIFNLYNPLVYDVADILDTYIYRITFADGGDFSFSAAVGLFKSITNFLLLLTVNWLVKKMGQTGIY